MMLVIIFEQIFLFYLSVMLEADPSSFDKNQKMSVPSTAEVTKHFLKWVTSTGTKVLLDSSMEY